MTFTIGLACVKAHSSKSLRDYGKREHLQTLLSGEDAVLCKLPIYRLLFV